jgi:hypothetical protein
LKPSLVQTHTEYAYTRRWHILHNVSLVKRGQ